MYAKVFRGLFYGSLTGQADAQLVLVCLLTHSDKEGYVELPRKVIETLTGLDDGRVGAAIGLLEGPDEHSRSGEQDGRRIDVVGQDRWLIVNYAKYRAMRDSEARREQNRINQRARRQRLSASVSRVSSMSAQVEVEAEVEAEVENISPASGEESMAEWRTGFDPFWDRYPRKRDRQSAEKAYMKLKPRTQETYNALLAGLDWWKTKEWAQRDPGMVEYASTWLNKRRWLDAQSPED